ncbi:MAG: oligosaccharide repeat unit polymerase [Acidobacteria bacterium]|nr:oligosaccharide repeat unit polymerase [Acidobacteriota bacterium]
MNSDLTSYFPYIYLLPWILALLLVFATPTLFLYSRGRLKFYDPLVYATWSYFFPAFVIGGFMLAGGWSQPYYLSFIQDAATNLPYTIVLIMLGFAGMSLGYFSSLGVKLGATASRFLPSRDFEPSALLTAGVVLLLLGAFNFMVAVAIGVSGYQHLEIVESYSGLVFLTTLFWMQGSFIIWYVLFSRGDFSFKSLLMVGLLFAATIVRALFSGNRSALFLVFVIVILAFVLSGGKLNFQKTAIAGICLSVCLMAGMIYGTTFRSVKGTESYSSVGEYTDNIYETFDEVGRFDLQSSVQFALAGLAERLDTLSSVAVVVSSYEQLQPYEESYGLDNNIWKDISTFFVPRILWNEKPVASEPRKYSDLYFNYGDNSFAITPVGDLLRNYGPIGVPIGMFLFGIVLRFIYRALIENQPRSISRATMYFMLLLSISYEGFYGVLIPFMFKVGFTAVIGLLIVGLIARGMGHRRVPAQA